MRLVTNVIKVIERRRLRWYRHVKRMGNERWPKKVLERRPKEKIKRGKLAEKWMNQVLKDVEERHFEQDLWNDRHENQNARVVQHTLLYIYIYIYIYIHTHTHTEAYIAERYRISETLFRIFFNI